MWLRLLTSSPGPSTLQRVLAPVYRTSPTPYFRETQGSAHVSITVTDTYRYVRSEVRTSTIYVDLRKIPLSPTQPSESESEDSHFKSIVTTTWTDPLVDRGWSQILTSLSTTFRVDNTQRVNGCCPHSQFEWDPHSQFGPVWLYRNPGDYHTCPRPTLSTSTLLRVRWPSQEPSLRRRTDPRRWTRSLRWKSLPSDPILMSHVRGKCGVRSTESVGLRHRYQWVWTWGPDRRTQRVVESGSWCPEVMSHVVQPTL